MTTTETMLLLIAVGIFLDVLMRFVLSVQSSLHHGYFVQKDHERELRRICELNPIRFAQAVTAKAKRKATRKK